MGALKIVQIPDPETEAEGLCGGIPYTTDCHSRDGCAIHFWFPPTPTPDERLSVLGLAMDARDIVKVTWSIGYPKGFWAHQNIEAS